MSSCLRTPESYDQSSYLSATGGNAASCHNLRGTHILAVDSDFEATQEFSKKEVKALGKHLPKVDLKLKKIRSQKLKIAKNCNMPRVFRDPLNMGALAPDQYFFPL